MPAVHLFHIAMVRVAVLIALGLSSQTPQEPDILKQMEQEKRRALGNQPLHHLVTVIATYKDGSPAAHKDIRCDGWWVQFVDVKEDGDVVPGGYQWSFHTDMRGAMVMNPGVKDDTLRCHAYGNGKTGSNRVWFENTPRPIILRIQMGEDE